MRWLGPIVSLGVVVSVACGADSGSDDPKGGVDAGFDAATPPRRDGGSSGIDSGPGLFDEKENLPCPGRTPSDAFSVYVAPSGNDIPNCGTRESPCQTVQTGIARAYATEKPKVLVGAGSYKEAIALDGGLTVEGGWQVSGATWTAACGADHSSLATIEAPDSANISVKATRGASVLRFLTIKSKPVAAPGESLYGLIAVGPAVKVALDDSHLVVAGGGPGDKGLSATEAGEKSCGSADDGAAGPSGKAGDPGVAGTLGSAGYTAKAGSDGAAGTPGHAGTAAPAVSTSSVERCVASDAGATCSKITATVGPAPGAPGCGGGGGKGGGGGGGGGSSVGIIATDAMIVLYGGSVTTGIGGAGGDGGEGIDGAPGASGLAGADATYAEAPSGACGAPPDCGNITKSVSGGAGGGVGGAGGAGGKGGGGAGGWSIGFAKFGTSALLASTTTSFQNGGGGNGGGPNGVKGLGQQQWP